MAKASAPMEIDDASLPSSTTDKGKSLFASDPKSAPWVEKYRPQSLADVAAHRDIIDTIDRLTSENRLPHLLLYGPPGTGKTSTILAVARKLYGAQYKNMILELNASDDRGIDVVRQQIQNFASARSLSFGTKSTVKLVLLDEADAMTKDAQFALRRVIEKHTKSTRFALICNHVNKIIPALQSRCTRFRFAPLDSSNIRERLEHVIKAEGGLFKADPIHAILLDNLDQSAMVVETDLLHFISLHKQLCTSAEFDCSKLGSWVLLEELDRVELVKSTYADPTKGKGVRQIGIWCKRCELIPLFKVASFDQSMKRADLARPNTIAWLDVDQGGLTSLVRLSNGDMRKALNILQSTHMSSQHINEEAVYLCTGNPMPKDIEQIAYWLLNESFKSAFNYISDVKMRKGLALVDIVREVTMFVFKIKMPPTIRVKLINDLADIEYELFFMVPDKT
ncbi:hypothetical protein ZIOFF_012250 [Zingiber officinale]|uniref:AAA+ ATPase domain-containing protein n=1 Tax=Zingiber officinale TaxID=94328 RepID=A0A8J5M383_ZINOF|nr:hypothetical protein ZIOFF_012250 [Zingiber officinale]